MNKTRHVSKIDTDMKAWAAWKNGEHFRDCEHSERVHVAMPFVSKPPPGVFIIIDIPAWRIDEFRRIDNALDVLKTSDVRAWQAVTLHYLFGKSYYESGNALREPETTMRNRSIRGCKFIHGLAYKS